MLRYSGILTETKGLLRLVFGSVKILYYGKEK